MDNITRGDIYWVNLDPTKGSEISKRRPCVIVSLSVLNNIRLTVIVVPLSSHGTPRSPLIMRVPSAGKDSNARIDQIRTIDKNRLGKKIGIVNEGDMKIIEVALKQVLGL